MLRVGHVLDTYPHKEHAFIYEQIRTAGERADRVLAALVQPDPNYLGPAHPAVAMYRLPGGTSELSRRIFKRLVEREGYQLHVRWLSSFLRRETRRAPLDLIHAHFGMVGARLVDFRRRSQLPLVTTFYGVDASALLRDPVWLARYEPLWRHGDGFVVLCDEVVERLVALGCPRERILVWNIAMDLAPYPYIERPLRQGPPRILCVARFNEKKGHLDLLEAFRQLPRELGATMTLIGYGDLRAMLEAHLQEPELAGRVTLVDTSQRSDFPTLYREALASHDVFVLPSKVAQDGDDEGGPALTMICAHAAGLPVISTPFAGAERSMIDGVTGLYCDHGSPASIAARLQELFADPARGQALGRAGSAHVAREFSLVGQQERLQEFYEHVMRHPRTGGKP